MMKLIRLYRKAKSPHKGFTLIELIMTITLLGVLSAPLSIMLFQHVSSTFQSEDYTVAANLARYQMENIRNLAYDSIDNFTQTNYLNSGFDMYRIVIFRSGGVGTTESLKEVWVYITRSGSLTPVESLVTYLARNVNYGL